jgi:hypothetical protein
MLDVLSCDWDRLGKSRGLHGQSMRCTMAIVHEVGIVVREMNDEARAA